jgi:hypothetical protein
MIDLTACQQTHRAKHLPKLREIVGFGGPTRQRFFRHLECSTRPKEAVHFAVAAPVLHGAMFMIEKRADVFAALQ